MKPLTREELDNVARELRGCAMFWEPDARLVGNVRADDIATLCHRFLDLSNAIQPAPSPIDEVKRIYEQWAGLCTDVSGDQDAYAVACDSMVAIGSALGITRGEGGK